MTRLALALGCAALIACLPEPPSDGEIAAYYARATRCDHDPTDVACCSRALGSSLVASTAAGQRVGSAGWTPLSDESLPDGVSRWWSQLPLNLCRGAALDLELPSSAAAQRCNDRDLGDGVGDSYVKLELGAELSDDTWLEYSERGLLTASLAGQERVRKCVSEPIGHIQLDLRPGMFGLEDVLFARLGIVRRGAEDQIDATQWLSKDIRLGSVRSFLERRHVRLTTRGALGSTRALTQLQGTCASAAWFERTESPLNVAQLGASGWATTIDEAALLIGQDSAKQDNWELLFSAERATEVGAAHRRSLGYCKRFAADPAWIAVPGEDHALLGPAARRDVSAQDADLRSPALALSHDGERVVAFTAGNFASHLELGYLSDAGVDVVQRIAPSSIAGSCFALAHPALVTLPDRGYLLYVTCCTAIDHECGSGVGSDVLWRASLTEQLELVETGADRPSAVAYDAVGRDLTESYHVVSVEALRDPHSQELRAWLLVQKEFQERVVYLARSSEPPYDFFDLHSDVPVLSAAELCPDEQCNLESIAVARADARSVRMLALTDRGVGPALTQSAHLLKQSLEVPW